MSFVSWCELCAADGIRSPVNLFQISASEAVKMCTRPQCLDLLNYSDNISAVFVKRHDRRCVTKAPVSEPARATQTSSLSRSTPFPTERCPLLQTMGAQDAAHDPAAHLSSKAEALHRSSEAKASDASEVCCAGKVLTAEAVALPVPTTAELFSSRSVAPAMPVASATGTDTCKISSPCVGSVDVAGNHPEQSEPCRQDALLPSTKSHTSGEKSSLLPAAMCGGRGEKGSARLEDEAEEGIAASSPQDASSAQVTGNGEERRDGKCGAASWTMRGAEKRSSQVQVAALVSGDTSVPSTVHAAPNEASEKCVAVAVHGDSAATTCLSGRRPVVRELQAGGENGTGHHDISALREANSDLSVSGCVDAGELNPDVSTGDPIASSLWIAETMFSLQCDHTQVAKNSVDGEDSTAVTLQPLGASGLQFDSTGDAFRDSHTDCMRLKGGVHQYQSEGTMYVNLEPLSPHLPAPSQGPPSSEQKGGTTVPPFIQTAVAVRTDGSGGCRARAVPAAVASARPTSSSAATSPVGNLPCTVPAQRTLAAVSSTPGDASIRAVQKSTSAGRAAPPTAPNAAATGTSSGSGRQAQKPNIKAPNRWPGAVHRAAASSPARTNRAQQKRETSPPRAEPDTTSEVYIVSKFSRIAGVLEKVELAPKCAVPGENKPENQRMPGRKRRKDAWAKRQAGPQSQRPRSPKKVLKLPFGRPAKLRRKLQADQVVPDVLDPARSPTPSGYSSQSSKPSSNCPSSPASCVSSGSDFFTTNAGGYSLSGSSSLQLMDYFPRQSTANEPRFPPYKVKELVEAPVKVARRGRPARKGLTDVGAEVDRYISELSH